MTILELTSYATLLFLLARLIVSITNQTWFSKLHLPPSPRALPIIGHLHLLGPLIHHSFHDLSSKYGPLLYLRLGSVPCIVASTPELAKEILRAQELTFSSRKHSIAIDLLTYNSAFAFAPYGPYWKFIKKVITTELLGNRILNQFLPIRTKELQHFIRYLANKAEASERVNVTEELLNVTNNIISQMMLSIKCSGSDNQAKETRSLVREVTKIFGEFNVSDFIWFCRNLDLQGFRKRIEDIHRRYDALLEKIILDREELRKKKETKEMTCDSGDDDVKDILDLLLDAMENENSEIKLTINHIKALVLDFFTAATDTSAIAIEWSLAELINHPMVLEKARKEIDKVVGNNRLIEESDCPNLPYIQAIIKETLRLHPPIPMVSRKSIKECNINGYLIPKDTLLFVNIWSIGREPKYWENPMDFMPERFLQSNEGDELIDIKGQDFQLLPFGTGRRGCPGISLAMQELPTILAAMIQCFNWRVVNPSGVEMNVVDMDERPGLTAPRATDLVCVPMARLNAYKILN
ncbi:hypothetical protein ACB094_08G036600 [Castanea mollissima]